MKLRKTHIAGCFRQVNIILPAFIQNILLELLCLSSIRIQFACLKTEIFCIIMFQGYRRKGISNIYSLCWPLATLDFQTAPTPLRFFLCLFLLCQYQQQAHVISPPPPKPEIQNSTSKQPSSGLFFLLGSLVLLIVLVVLVLILWKFFKKGNLRALIGLLAKPPGMSDDTCVHLRTISYFDFHTLKKATKNFHPDNLLGCGGFGPVFRGKLGDGQLIAVKKLSVDKSQQGEREFLAEVRVITSIQHKNLVRLLGCCSDGAQRLLVYEYMKNRSLDQILYGKSCIFLDWKTRYQIISGIARGLQYLHEDSHIRIVHRDIKASNILLDDKFQPRIGDFGLARFFPEDQAYLSTAFAGTLGYTAPEYAIRGELTEKADIYSFGVLMLEIISCRRNTDLSLPSEMQYLPEYAWKLYERSRLIDLVDPKMFEDGIMEKDVLQTIYVALLCVQAYANLRPPMSEVVATLVRKVAIVETPTRPAFLDRKRRNVEEKPSWDTITDGFPSPLQSDSPSLSRPQK